ncbi:hypothetical protein BBJ28_00025414 [Nothophytophthora sp. Chile5]|nr:hypothetical protein BBJ28_00025414 [Nothophytophthora sp. Chile5]
MFYANFILVMVRLPSAQYHTELAGITRENVGATVNKVYVYALLEFASFVLLAVMMQRKCGVRALYHLSFVLETQMPLIQGKLMTWMLLTLTSRVVHFAPWIEHTMISPSLPTQHGPASDDLLASSPASSQLRSWMNNSSKPGSPCNTSWGRVPIVCGTPLPMILLVILQESLPPQNPTDGWWCELRRLNSSSPRKWHRRAIVVDLVLRGILAHRLQLHFFLGVSVQTLMSLIYSVYQVLFNAAADTSYELPATLLLPVIKLIMKTSPTSA